MAPATASNPSQAVRLGDGVFWLGERTPGQILIANPYLIFDAEQGETPPFSLLVDPITGGNFEAFRAKCERVMGSIDTLDAVFINHQDPDVSAALSLLLQPTNAHTHLLCSDETWHLMEMHDIDHERYVNADDFPNGFRGRSGRVLEPVPSQFCHFVGSRMLYDRKTRILFSGDLFASLTARDAEGLFADESDWLGMRAFHQIYMPTNRAMAMAIRRIRALDPPVEMIAPQHGRLLRGEILQRFLDRLESLDVGLDILDAGKESDATRDAWQRVLTRVLELAESLNGANPTPWLESDPFAASNLSFESSSVRIVRSGKQALERSVAVLVRQVAPVHAEALKYEALAAAYDLDLPTPMIELEEGGGSSEPLRRRTAPFEAL